MTGRVGEIPPRPPAAAYGIVAATVPTWYLDEEPPLAGTELIVTGGDGIPTRWAMSSDVADVVAGDLARLGGVTVRSRPYVDRVRR